MVSVAVTLAEWAAGLEPGREDLELAASELAGGGGARAYLEYAAAAALLDSYAGFGSFTDEAVRRDAATTLRRFLP